MLLGEGLAQRALWLAAAATAPAGLLLGITPLTTTAGGGVNALLGDVKKLLAAIAPALRPARSGPPRRVRTGMASIYSRMVRLWMPARHRPNRPAPSCARTRHAVTFRSQANKHLFGGNAPPWGLGHRVHLAD
jgi:hypothetical protein